MTGAGDFAGLDVSRETMGRLQTYASLLERWNPQINLVSKQTIPHLWKRHFVDSIQLYENAPSQSLAWLDMGSGGGFPGMVIAILSAELLPDRRVILLESDQRKCVFLRTVAREAGVQLEIINARIEEIPAINVDVVSARALAPLDMLLRFVKIHGKPGGTGLFPKGRSWRDEVSEAQKHWRFKHTVLPSKTDSEAVILRIEDIEHV